MTLRRVGYFRELPHGDPESAALRESVGAASVENESAILTYLTHGNVLATSPMLVHDALDAGGQPLGTLQILTDGTWEWPSDLAHYVRTRHVRLPADFVRHMASHHWEVPRLSEAQLMELLQDSK
ncbi:MAG: hypothetical protein QOE72_2018 [Chloroflexota bacterium]|nr:hypothetical protein [Chloroflexota bacterium]